MEKQYQNKILDKLFGELQCLSKYDIIVEKIKTSNPELVLCKKSGNEKSNIGIIHFAVRQYEFRGSDEMPEEIVTENIIAFSRIKRWDENEFYVKVNKFYDLGIDEIIIHICEKLTNYLINNDLIEI